MIFVIVAGCFKFLYLWSFIFVQNFYIFQEHTRKNKKLIICIKES